MKLAEALREVAGDIADDCDGVRLSPERLASGIIRFIDSYKDGDVSLPELRRSLLQYLWREDRYEWRVLNPDFEQVTFISPTGGTFTMAVVAP